MKKGELSINLIVVTAIALIVLVVLAYLIFGVPRDIDDSKACEVLNGECVYDTNCDSLEGYTINAQGRCGEGQICCLSVTG